MCVATASAFLRTRACAGGAGFTGPGRVGSKILKVLVGLKHGDPRPWLTQLQMAWSKWREAGSQ